MPRPRLRLLAALLALAPAAAPGAAPARPAAPTLESFHPPVVVAGTATAVTAAGKFADWPPAAWTDHPGIRLYAGSTRGAFRVEVAPDVPAGPHLVRLHSPAGASDPRFLLVAATAPLAETEPNDEPTQAQSLPAPPVVLTGRLGRTGDTDSYAFELAAGQTFTAEVDAQVIASPVDAVLRVLDPRGVEVAFNHDRVGHPDPRLTYTAVRAGRHVLQVFGFAHPATADVRLHGSDAAVYRLSLTPGAAPSRGTAVAAAPAAADGEPPRPPFLAGGVIGRPGELGRHGFRAARGEALVLAVRSAALGFPLDAWLAVRDPAGKELARNDDGPGTGADPLLEWKAPADGTYAAVVGSLLQRGGTDHRYELEIRPARPRLEAVVAQPGLVVDAGGEAELKVTLRRVEGFRGSVVASVAGLPGCVTAEPVAADDKRKELALTVKVPPDAAAFSGPIEVRLRAEKGTGEWTARHELGAAAPRNGVPQGFRDLLIPSTAELWLTVRAPEAPPPPPAAK